jgi:hydroxypyruvate isomerase
MTRRELLAAGAGLGLASVRNLAGQTSDSHPLPAKPTMTSSVMLWTLKGSFEERVETAARAGMQSTELVGEYAGWTDAQVREKKKFVRSFGMGMDTIIATPDWGSRPVSMVDPAQRENFLNDVRQAIVYAQKLETPMIILMSGNEIAGRTREEQYASLFEGTKRAGDLAAKAGVTLIVEPLNNKVNHKGFYLTTCTEGLKLIREVDNPHVRLLFDLYHEQVQAGNVIETMQKAVDYVAVFHVADAPGRHDPGTGQMDWTAIYKAIQKTGYKGYLTMEYLPVGDSTQSLIKSVDGFRAAIRPSGV